MTNFLRLSEHQKSQQWIAQFYDSKDRALATQLINQLKLVSNREFECGIEQAITRLHDDLKARIAVYPVAPPIPNEIAGYDPFTGGIPREENTTSRAVGRRRQFGSEDRVGHILKNIQERFKRDKNSTSSIECCPTLIQLKTQKIYNIVLVDDICGSGKRITDYWKKLIPRHIKSLLSFKRYNLWIILYAITRNGKNVIFKTMPNFPHSNLITVLPEIHWHEFLTSELRGLCTSYARKFRIGSSGLGYRDSLSNIVFEHGCPNNLPKILWMNINGWSGLFPNRSIPNEMRPCFDADGSARASEVLWQVNQPGLALSLLDALDHTVPLTTEQRIMLAMLGLRLRGVSENNLAVKLFLTHQQCKEALQILIEMGLYDKRLTHVTQLGREFVSRFRERFGPARRLRAVAKSPESYYPQQCEGELQ
ncbi:MAG: hypothetical protein HQL96_03320 [Magnetococcales bacterium]|nr:hypothetical protein [Magnetococcales bacterium]